MNSLSAVFFLITFHLSSGGGALLLSPGGQIPGEVWTRPIWGFWMTLGFSYHLASVPIIDQSDIQEKAGYHGIFS